MTDDYAQPHVTYNRITTGTIRKRDGWHITIHMDHTETGVERFEESSMTFPSEAAAENFAVKLAHQMRARIQG